MPPIEVWIGLLVIAVPCVALAERFAVPWPVALVVSGTVIGFIPGLPAVRFPPELVLLVFLPPLLYWEAVTAPSDEMRTNGRWIWTLAIGLTVASTLAVAVVAHAVVPNLSWAVALVLGAIVAPTDEIAVAPVAERLGVPRHVLAIIEGESLLNDAVSLVIYAAAVGAVVTGVFSPGSAVLHLVVAAAGSAILGVAVGWFAVVGWRWFRQPQLQGAISFCLPFLAYEPAQRLGLSGVLAVVAAGIYVARRTPEVMTAQARLRSVGYWETFVFLANAVVFVLLGLQLRAIAQATFARHPWTSVLVWALALNATIVAVRIAWVYAQGAFAGLGRSSEGDGTLAKHLAVTAAAGLRGSVSLAAALALPTTIAHGAPFPDRDLVVFLTMSVIVVTLIGGGIALPWFIARLHVAGDGREEAETRTALDAMTDAALAAIDEQERRGAFDHQRADELRRRYERRHADPPAPAVIDGQREVVAAQRRALLALRKGHQIDNAVLRRLQAALDLDELGIDENAGITSDAAEVAGQ